MKCVLTLWLFILWTAVSAQNISGRITTDKNEPADYVTITLNDNTTNKPVKAVISDAGGQYIITNVALGSYYLTISTIGFLKQRTAAIKVNKMNIELPAIQLLPDNKLLADVVVTAKKPGFEQRPDKLILNVNGALSAGTTADQLLRRAPGLKLVNDKLTMPGKNKLVVMIDGRLSQYQDVGALLKTMPSSNIARIEIINNPSAKYDAEGDAVINIILKQKQTTGTSGTLGLSADNNVFWLDDVNKGASWYQRYNPSASINHQLGKLNVFGSYNYLYRSQFEVNLIERIYQNSHYDQRSYNPIAYDTHTWQAGLSFTADSQNVIGLQANGFFRRGAGNFVNTSIEDDIYDGQLLDAFTSANKVNNKNNNTAVNINWRHSFKQAKQTLAVDADVVQYNFENQNQITVQPATKSAYLNSQRVNTPIYFETVKADYTQVVTNRIKIEAGAKTSLANINNKLYFSQNGVSNSATFSRFNYRENINAAYANAAYHFNRWDAQAGLRAEQTVAKGKSDIQQVLARNYVQLFTSVQLTRKLDSTLAITGQYNRRIGRPSYQQQNPFEFYLDPLTYTKGNPFLKPQITNSGKLSLTYTGLPVFSLGYDLINNIIVEYAPQQKTIIDANGLARLVSFSVADNLAKASTLTAQLNFPIKAGNVIDGYGGIISSRQAYHAFYQGDRFDAAKWNFTFFVQTDFKFSSNWTGQLSTYYATPSQYEFIRAGKNSSVDLGLSRKLSSRATLSLNTSDLFFGDKTTGVIRYQDINLKLKQYSDTRSALLVFTYRFGNVGLKNSEAHRIGAEEENQRIKNN